MTLWTCPSVHVWKELKTDYSQQVSDMMEHDWTHCTSAVHVAGCYRMHVASLEVQQKTGFRVIPLHAHQSIQNHLHTEKHLHIIRTAFFTQIHNLCVQSTNLTTMFYWVWFLSGFQLQGDSHFLWNSATAVSWSLDPNPCRQINFPFEAKSWWPDIFLYICQLCDCDNRVLTSGCCSAAVGPEDEETVTKQMVDSLKLGKSILGNYTFNSDC